MLGVIEALGGRLARTDCLKLLFLLSQQEGNPRHYDFFPFHYGPFSYVAMQDKRRLTDLGHLKDAEDFVLTKATGHLDALQPSDLVAVLRLRSNVGVARGRELMKRVYLEYPSFCCRSRVVDEVLSEDEKSRVAAVWNTDSSPCLFTIGYEGRTIDSFLCCLVGHNMRSVVDVRCNAVSMKYGFSKNALGRYLAASGVHYVHSTQLGIPSAFRDDLGSPESYHRLFGRYREEILPRASESLKGLEEEVASYGRVALMCFEANPFLCHRHVVANAVVTAVPGLALHHVSESGSVFA